jgi:hypothetical protein
MFTLGNKEAIVNSPAQYPFSPALANTALLNIKGFGTFDQTKILSAKAARFQAGELAQLTFTSPSAAALGIAASAIGVSVVVHLRVNSLRQSSEDAIDFIKRGRPLILEIMVDGGDSAAAVALKVQAQLLELPFKFTNWVVPFTSSINGADITLVAGQDYFQFTQAITFLKRGDIFATNAVSTNLVATALTINDPVIAPGNTTLILSSVAGLTVGQTISFATFPLNLYKITDIVTSTTTITFAPALPADLPVTLDIVSVSKSGKESVNGGKDLEETVRMSTPFTNDVYGIQPGEVPIIGAKYTMVNWVHSALGAVGGWQDHKAPGAVAKAEPSPEFTLYFLEDSSLGAGGQVELLLTWLDVSANVALTDFKKANGASAVSYADFIA